MPDSLESPRPSLVVEPLEQNGPLQQILEKAGTIFNTHYTSHTTPGNRFQRFLKQVDAANPTPYEVKIEEVAADSEGSFAINWTGKTDSSLRLTEARPKYDEVTFKGVALRGNPTDITVSQNAGTISLSGAEMAAQKIPPGVVIGALATHIDRVDQFFQTQKPKKRLFDL